VEAGIKAKLIDDPLTYCSFAHHTSLTFIESLNARREFSWSWSALHHNTQRSWS